jgi:AraC family transcriptional regulator
MRKELDAATIVRTSDYTGFEGLRVVVREWPQSGTFGTSRKGTSSFRLAYRPGEERGRTVVRFREAPELETRMNRVSALVPPGRAFEVSHSDAQGKLATFEIEPGFLADVVNRAGIAPIMLDRVPPAGFLINRRVNYLCNLLLSETERGIALPPLYFESLATALVVAVVSQTDRGLPGAGNLYVQNQQIQQAVSYIEANFHSRITLPEIAGVAHLSPFHFSRLFNRMVGLSPHEYLLQCRLRFAERLLSLLPPDYSIANVAIESGFADQAHFSRHFRRAFGKSPQAYRREQN